MKERIEKISFYLSCSIAVAYAVSTVIMKKLIKLLQNIPTANQHYKNKNYANEKQTTSETLPT